MKKQIVAGESLHHPWMTFIQINNQLLPQCSGSIINNYWILSAGHCFCKLLKCKASKGGNLRIAFKPKDHIRIIAGLRDINQIESSTTYQILTAKKIFIHPL
jgi:hypothetical protein